jgi:hypothetical protein
MVGGCNFRRKWARGMSRMEGCCTLERQRTGGRCGIEGGCN